MISTKSVQKRSIEGLSGSSLRMVILNPEELANLINDLTAKAQPSILVGEN